MAFKTIVGFAAALAAVGVDALVCRPGSSSIALSSTLTTSTAILETSSTATVSTSEESTSASTTAEATTTTSIISTTEEPTSSTAVTTTSSVPASCPTQGLTCGEAGYVVPNMSVRFTTVQGTGVEDCKASCSQASDCAFFAMHSSNLCMLFKVPSGPAGYQRASTAAYVGYDRGCFVC